MDFKQFINKRTIIAVVVVLFLILLLNKFVFTKNDAGKGEKRPVRTMVIELSDLKRAISFTGDIKGQEEVQVFPNVTGRLIKNVVNEGDIVKKGDVISYIDRDEVGFKFKEAPVDSPITGLVGRLYLDKGTEVTSSTPIALVSDMRNVKVKISIVERDFPLLKLGMMADVFVDAYPDQVFKGEISKLAPVIDRTSRTAPAEITISNSDFKLRSGMFSRVDIVADSYGGVIALPREIILMDEDTGKPSVFLVENGVVKKAMITIGAEEGNLVVIKEGLNLKDEVVTDGYMRITDGESVVVK